MLLLEKKKKRKPRTALSLREDCGLLAAPWLASLQTHVAKVPQACMPFSGH